MEKQDNFKARKVEDLESYGKRETVQTSTERKVRESVKYIKNVMF